MYLELIIGPMFSGKTSYLIDLYRRFNIFDGKVVIVNHILDNRYGNQLYNHNGDKVNCSFSDIIDIEYLKQFDYILINEGQFFTNLAASILELIEKHGKSVYISGLDGNYKRECFGEMHKLIPLADNIIKKYAICVLCRDNTKAIFTKKLSNSKGEIVVGGKKEYIPVCRRHYLM